MMQAGVISGLAAALGVEVCKHPVDNPHAENKTDVQVQPIGSVAFTSATTPTTPVLFASSGWTIR